MMNDECTGSQCSKCKMFIYKSLIAVTACRDCHITDLLHNCLLLQIQYLCMHGWASTFQALKPEAKYTSRHYYFHNQAVFQVAHLTLHTVHYPYSIVVMFITSHSVIFMVTHSNTFTIFSLIQWIL